MSTEASWEHTEREFDALARVHKDMVMRWAITCAQFANVHYRSGERWEPEHFLGKPRRPSSPIEEIRSKMRTHNAAIEQMEVMRANSALARIQPGAEVDDLPAWATMPHPGDKQHAR